MRREKRFPSFLGSKLESVQADDALFHVIPIPYASASFSGSGVKMGSSAILKASAQLEPWDGHSVPAQEGIYTHSSLKMSKDPKAAIETIANKVMEIVAKEQIPVLLGGAHTLSWGAFKGIQYAHDLETFSNGELPGLFDKTARKSSPSFGVVQIDAHANLRNTYEESFYDPCCVMRRAWDMGVPIYYLGIRSYSIEEKGFIKNFKIPGLTAEEVIQGNLKACELPPDFPEKIYLTIDVDGFDSSIFPFSEKTVPGGIGWFQGMNLIKSIAKQRRIIGFDVVEHAPKKGMPAPDNAVAQLVYHVMGIVSRGKF